MGITVKQARIGANLTMEEIAKKLEIHAQTYSALEKNPEKMTIEKAKEFAEIVNVPFDEIIFLSSNSN